MELSIGEIIGLIILSNIPTAVLTFILNKKKVKRQSDAILFSEWEKLEARVSAKNDILENKIVLLEEKLAKQTQNIGDLQTNIKNQNLIIDRLNEHINVLNKYINDINKIICSEAPFLKIPEKPKNIFK